MMRLNRPARSIIALCLVLPACALLSAPAAGQEKPYVPVYHPELKISRAAGPIEIDGDLGDAGWSGAAKIGNFAEHNPGQPDPARRRHGSDGHIRQRESLRRVAVLRRPGAGAGLVLRARQHVLRRLRDPVPRHVRRGDACVRDRGEPLRHSGRPSLFLCVRGGRQATT